MGDVVRARGWLSSSYLLFILILGCSAALLISGIYAIRLLQRKAVLMVGNADRGTEVSGWSVMEFAFCIWFG